MTFLIPKSFIKLSDGQEIGMVNIDIECIACSETETIKEQEGIRIDSWAKGEYIQNAFPHLDATKREMMVSGLCSECQKAVFGG